MVTTARWDQIEEGTFIDWKELEKSDAKIPVTFIGNVSDEEEIFDELVSNKIFLKEAKETRRQIEKDPSCFINFTKKYSYLIR